MGRMSDKNRKLLEPTYERLKVFYNLSHALPRPSGYFELGVLTYTKRKNDVLLISLYATIDSISESKDLDIEEKDKIVSFVFKTINEAVRLLVDSGELKTSLGIKTKCNKDLIYLITEIKKYNEG